MSQVGKEAVSGCLPRAQAPVTCVPPASSQEVGTTQEGGPGRRVRGDPVGSLRGRGSQGRFATSSSGPPGQVWPGWHPFPSPRFLPCSPRTVGEGPPGVGEGRALAPPSGRDGRAPGSAGPSPRPLRPITARSQAARCRGRHEAAVSVRRHVFRGRARGGGAGAGGAPSQLSSPRPAPPRPLTVLGLDTPTPKPGRVSREGTEVGGWMGHLGRQMGTLRTDGDT